MKKIKVMREGVEKEADIIAAFALDEAGTKYVIYTFNEKHEGNIKIYASTYVERDGVYILENIKDDHAWEQIKEAIRQLAKKGAEINDR